MRKGVIFSTALGRKRTFAILKYFDYRHLDAGKEGGSCLIVVVK
jgi:hypothetical protein